MGSIKLSNNHGVNPSVMLCFFCMESTGVALLGRLPGDKAAPASGCYDKRPCTKCQEYMKTGVILISVNEANTTDENNPYRSGGWVVVTEDAIRKAITDPNMLAVVLKSRVAFITDDAWLRLGLELPGQAPVDSPA